MMPAAFATNGNGKDTPYSPGRLAHKWVEDFITTGLANENICFSVGCAAESQQHDFEVKHEQCVSTTARQADAYYTVIVSSICMKCRHHFIFRIEAPTGKLCGKLFDNPEKPLHHLIPSEDQPKDYASCDTADGRDLSYLQCCGHAAYECSDESCYFRVVVEVSQPRLPDEHIRTLNDDEAVKERHRRGMEEEPDRFGNLPNTNLAPRYLLRYLSDVVKEPESRRPQKINTRNVKFSIHFGTDKAGEALFTFLNFSKLEEGENRFWLLPVYEVAHPTPVPSAQSFYQDLLAECKALIGQRLSEDDPTISLKDMLKESLHCSETQCDVIENKPENYTPAGKPSDYELLGLTPNSHWRIFEFAFDCQLRVDHNKSHVKTYVEALRSIGARHNQESLNMRIAFLESMLEADARSASSTAANEAMKELLDGKTTGEILGEYRNKFENSAMGQNKEIAGRKKVALRMELEKISRFRDDPVLMDAVREPMELEEAMACLELPGDIDQLKNMDAEVLHGLASGQSQQEKGGLLAGMALEQIAIFIRNETLGQMAKDMIHSSLNISPPEKPKPPVDFGLPVGLENIRNTCYLNSILQYLFTVNPVRDIVLHWDQYKLADSEESRQQRHISTKQGGISVGESFVAEQFVNELRSLFTDLQSSMESATRPSQKLALAAMNSADQLEKRKPPQASATAVASLEPSTAAPPLPARPAPSPPPLQLRDGNARPGPSSGPTVEHIETASNVSSQTLVQNDDEPDHGYVNINHLGSADDDSSISWANLRRVDSVRSSGRSSMVCEINPDDLDQSIDGAFDLGDTPTSHVSDVVMTDQALGLEVSQTPVEVVQTADGPEAPNADAAGNESSDAVGLIRKALNDSSVSGTDQQDVQEVMGKMLYHLQAAIRPTGEDPDTKTQTDRITSVLYLTKVEHRKHPGDSKWLETVIPEAWLLAYPPSSGIISLHDALDNAFRRELIDHDQPNPWYHFGSIRKFPPILHICIQRSGDNGRKNGSPINIPKVMYMDRYQEAAPGSDLLNRRLQSWDLHTRIQQVQSLVEETKPKTETTTNLKEDPADDRNLEAFDSFVAHKYGRNSPSRAANGAHVFSAQNPESTGSGANAAGVTAEVTKVNGDHNVVVSQGPEPSTFTWEPTVDPAVDIEALKTQADGLFDHLKEHEYHLHAVVCHMGKTGSSGHYWVWIFDFEQNVWRKYNDSAVTVMADSDQVMQELSSSGEPYYLAYVRKENIDMVSIPRRGQPDAMDVAD